MFMSKIHMPDIWEKCVRSSLFLLELFDINSSLKLKHNSNSYRMNSETYPKEIVI